MQGINTPPSLSNNKQNMKLIICNNECTFQIEGASFESIVRLLRLPEWTIESYNAWLQNCRTDNLTLHVAKELLIMVEYSPHVTHDRANVEEIQKE